jgi:hypothetical protein
MVIIVFLIVKTTHAMMILKNTFPIQLLAVKKLLDDAYNLVNTQLTINHESKEYAASSFLLSDKKNIYRQAKITPTKPGQSRNGILLESMNRLLKKIHLIFFIITVKNKELLR